MKLNITLKTIIITSALFVSSCVSGSVEKQGRAAVGIELWLGPRLHSMATGVILHSSQEHGTFVLTNAHVIGVVGKHPLTGEDVLMSPGVVTVRMPDGSRRKGRILKVGQRTIMEEGQMPQPIDLALVHIPNEGEKPFEGVEGFSGDGIQPGEKVRIWPVEPRDSVHSKYGVGIEDNIGFYRDSVRMEEEPISRGNSGSGIYEVDTGLLAGIVWGNDVLDKEGKSFNISYLVEIQEIKEFLKDTDASFLVN